MPVTTYTPPGLPTAMPFPQASAFPTAQPSLPANPYAPQTSGGVTPYAPPGLVAAANAVGLSASSAMTEDEALAQSETAIAKLAQVNPGLAQELVEKRTDSGSGGILGFFKDTVGGLVSGGLSVFGQFFDVISRPAHIVPQWVNPDDEGNAFADIGQALSGEDKTNWNEALTNMGVGGPGWLRATVGFGLDVASDPTTYATFGASAGVGVAERAASAAKTLATKGAMAERLASITGKALPEAEQLLKSAWTKASGQVDNITQIRKYADGGAEELLGALGRSNESEIRALLQDSFDVGAQAYRKVYARTFKNFLANPESKIFSSIDPGRVLATGEQAKPIFEAIARGANLSKYGDEAWGAAKAAAGAMGGLRFRYAVPFTKFRYISPMVPGTYKLGVGAVARFASGYSGFKVVEKMGPAAEALFQRVGYKGIQELAENGDAITKKLAEDILGTVKAGRASYIRSGFYTAADGAGKLTAHLAPGAKLFRRGLGYYWYRNGMKQADSMRARLVNDLFYAVDPDASQVGAEIRRDLFRRYDRNFGKKAMQKVEKAQGVGASQEYLRATRKYVDYFGHADIPKTVADVQTGKLDDWFWHSSPERTDLFLKNKQYAAGAVPNPTAMDYQKQAALLADMKNVLLKVKDDARVVLDDMVATETFGKTTLERQGVDIGDVAMRLAEARVIHPDDVKYLGDRPAFLAREFQATLPSGSVKQMAKYGGVTADWSVAHEDLGVVGVRLDLSGAGGDSVPVQLRVHNVMDVDLNDLDNIKPATQESIDSGTATLPEILAAYDVMYKNHGAAMARNLNPLFDNHLLHQEWELTSRAELATEVLKKRPGAPDAIRFMRGGQQESMVVLDWTKVHAVSESAQHLRPKGGYFRRVLAKPLRAKLGGEARLGEAKLFGDPGQVEASFVRETKDMSLEEAEAHIRAKVNAAGGRYEGITISDTEDVFEWDVLKGHQEYIDYLGDDYFSHVMGRVTGRMLELGNLVPPEFGSVARMARAKFSMPDGTMRHLASADKATQNAYVKLQQRMADEEARQAKTLTDAHTRLSQTLAYMDAGLTAEDVSNQALVLAMDGVVRSGANLQRVVAENARVLTHKLTALRESLGLSKNVEAQLRVTEWDDLDQLLDSRHDPYLDQGYIDAPPSSHSSWDEETEALKRAQGLSARQQTTPMSVEEATVPAPRRAEPPKPKAVPQDELDSLKKAYLKAKEDARALEEKLDNLPDSATTDAEQALDKKVTAAQDKAKQAEDAFTAAGGRRQEDIEPTEYWTVEENNTGIKFDENDTGINYSVVGQEGEVLNTFKTVEEADGYIQKLQTSYEEKLAKRTTRLEEKWRQLNEMANEAQREVEGVGKDGTNIATGRSYDEAVKRARDLRKKAADAYDEYRKLAYGPEAADVAREDVDELTKLALMLDVANARKALDEDIGTGARSDALFDELDAAEERYRDVVGEFPPSDLGRENIPHIQRELDKAQADAISAVEAEQRRFTDALNTPSPARANVPEGIERMGSAKEVAPNVWRYKRSLGGEFDETMYVYTDDTGRVVGYRAIEDETGQVNTAVAEDLQHQGIGHKLGLAHWHDEGVKDFPDVVRVVGGNEFSQAGLNLNKRMAREILEENGIYRPETIRDLLKRGELYAGPDGSILTKSMGIRKGGRKLRSVDDLQREIAEMEGTLNSLDELRKTPPTKLEGSGSFDEQAATGLTRAERRASQRFANATEKAETAVRDTVVRENKAAMKRGGIHARIRRAVTLASDEFNRAQANLQGVYAEMRPAVEFGLPPTGGKTMLREVQIPGLGGVHAHPFVAEEMESLFRGKPVGHLRSLWREHLLGPWKRWATYRNPGFHVRNIFGAWFNNTLGGVTAADHEFSRLVNMARGNYKGWAEKTISDEHWARYHFENFAPGMKGQVTYGDVSEMLADMGMGRANTTSTAITMGGETAVEKGRGWTLSRLKQLDDKLRGAGGLTEDYFRVAAWAGGMRHLDGDLYGARAFTMLRHGDYSDLTDTEDFIRDLVPFYKWMRTNVPFQIRMLAENPGFFATVDKAQTLLYDVQGLDRYQEEFKQPEWMRRGFNIPLGGSGSFITADLPMADLHNGARDYLSAGLPMIRNVVESMFIKQNTFTGAPLGEKMVPLSGIFANPVMEPLIAALPWAQRGPDGQVFIPDTIDNVLGAVPMYSRFHNWMVSDPNRVENRVATFTSALLGVGIKHEDLLGTELAFFYDELVPAMDNMRSMGVTLPTAEQLQEAGVAIDAYGAAPNADDLFPDGVAAVTQKAA